MQPIILLHGAIGSAAQLEPLAQLLKSRYTVHTLNFRGHGGEAFPESPFSIQLFAEQLLDYIGQHQLVAPTVFGYSMGGYVGMYIARHYPGKIGKLITLATKFEWTEAIAAKQQRSFDAAVIMEKAPAMASQLEQLHAPNNWKEVLVRTGEMLTALGTNNALALEDYSQIHTPCLIMQGDKDRMVTMEETIAVYRAMPAANASLCILPGTPHPLEQTDLNLLASFIGR